MAGPEALQSAPSHPVPVPGFWTLAQERSDSPALITSDGIACSFGQLGSRVDRLSHGLRDLGLGPGSVLAVALPNCVEYVEIFLATQQIGVDVLTLSTSLTVPEAAYILRDSGASVLVTSEELMERFVLAADECGIAPSMVLITGFDGTYEKTVTSAPAAPVGDRRTGTTLLYTSGTTGRPKGVRRRVDREAAPESVYAAHAQRWVDRYDWQPGDGVHLVCGPLYHRASSTAALLALMMGHAVVVTPKWDPTETLALIERFRVTTTHMVPTMFHRLLALPQDVRDRYDVSSLRSVVHAAAPCPVEDKRAMLDWWGPVVYEYYAASEGGGTVVRPDEWFLHPGTVGRPWAGAAVEVRDDRGRAPLPPGEIGTIWIGLDGQDFEYLNDPDKTAASRSGGMFTVGDLGYMDDEGWLFLADRRSDLIISGGVNIYPAEVEAVLRGHRDVDEVAVVGVDDPDWGQSVKAVVVLRDGASPPESEPALRELVAEHLARFKQPRSYEFVAALPRNEIGKVLKRALR